MATILIALIAVFFLSMGLLGLAAPAMLMKPLGIALTVPEARNEVRAVYGGFGVAVAALLGCAAADVAGLRPGAVLAIAAALAGMALGRLISRAFDRPSAFYPTWFFFWVELIAAALLVYAAA